MAEVFSTPLNIAPETTASLGSLQSRPYLNVWQKQLWQAVYK